jgi:hypothetical protein
MYLQTAIHGETVIIYIAVNIALAAFATIVNP